MTNQTSGSDIFPSYIMRTTNSDGSVSTSSIYTIEAIANQYLLIGFLILVGAAFLAPFAAVILAILYVTMIDKNLKLLPIIGILICGYLLYDIKHNWIISIFFNIFANPIEKVYILRVTVCMLFTHIILLFLGRTLYYIAFRNKLMFFVYVLLISLLSYFIGAYILIDFLKIKFV